ncbi:hypothetical protein JYU34_005856 [Plutella xylostella]|uniref:Uncharacterized protein n=1 Tax=Plutella xylostella TaxID=51655 RepID=A0ABQ7QUB8_PLUXY|nr:hypothetical protein JYU34_005856 [Plutella xylostella]
MLIKASRGAVPLEYVSGFGRVTGARGGWRGANYLQQRVNNSRRRRRRGRPTIAVLPRAALRPLTDCRRSELRALYINPAFVLVIDASKSQNDAALSVQKDCLDVWATDVY